MNLLDENILASQRQLLKNWRIRVRQIGYDIGQKGMQDDVIITFLHELARPTLFTRDLGFYQRDRSHQRYCLICLAVEKHETASFSRRVLRHPEFDTRAKRMGAVIRVSHKNLRIWRLNAEQEATIDWVE
ncbi:MAG: DUF5615 family PIN-like protein [Planctomycetaceae bacterium]